MALRIEIDCYCEYKCTCKPIAQTKVTKQEIAYNLIRCNPSLARYFSNHLSYTETIVDRKELRQKSPKPYKSIVEEKNMNILLSDRYSAPASEAPPKKEDIVQIKINNFIDTYVQTSPKNHPQDKKPREKPQKDPTKEQIQEYYRQLKQTSRYLPNTAFKKYFNRPIFQNYGRQNTTGTNDGIIYGNYLKTHNINPHLGQNRPHDEETFYHALISASPDKLLGPKSTNLVEKQKGRNLSLTKLKQDKSLQKPIKKHQNNEEIIAMDNIHQHNKLNKLSQAKLSPKSHLSTKVIKITPDKSINKYSPIKQSKSPKGHEIKSPASISSQYVNQKQHIQVVRPTPSQNNNQVISHRTKVNKQQQEIRQFRQSNANQNKPVTKIDKEIQIQQSPKRQSDKCPVDKVKQHHMEHILSKDCNAQKSPRTVNKVAQKSTNKKEINKMDFGPGSPKSCTCAALGNKGKCECLSSVKKQLKQKAQKDIDLNNRLITSARKATLYKNYALNSGQNAKLDPHNYSHCCGTIYQK